MKQKIATSFSLAILLSMLLCACAVTTTQHSVAPTVPIATLKPVVATTTTPKSDFKVKMGEELRFLTASKLYVIVVKHNVGGLFSVEQRMIINAQRCVLDASRTTGFVCELFSAERCRWVGDVTAHKVSEAAELTVTTSLKPIKEGEVCYSAN